MRLEKDIYKQRWIIGVILFAVLCVFDQWTKYLAVNMLMGRGAYPIIPGVLELLYLENTGAAFSILAGKTYVFYAITLVFGGMILYVMLRLVPQKRYQPLFYGLVVLFSGAMGNFYDRIVHRYVVDFIYVSLIDFPVFNVADIYVTTSVVFLFCLLIFYYRDEDLTDFISGKSSKGGKGEQ